MRLSARNQITGTVHAIEKGNTTSIVEVQVAPGVIISAIIDNHSFGELDLEIGKSVVVIVKASNVIVGISEWLGDDRPVSGEPLL